MFPVPEALVNDPVFAAILLVAIGVLAGAINVIAGGGSFLTVPMLIFLGLPPTVANGTNRLAVITQNIGAVWAFQRRRLIRGDWLLPAVAPAVAGAGLGTVVAVAMGDLAFQRTLAIFMVAMTAWTLWRPLPSHGDADAPPPRDGQRLGYFLAWFAVGLYGGAIQAGVGFVVLAVTSAAGLDLIRGNALKVTLILIFTPLTLLIFAWTGKVDWAMAAWLAVGNYAGGILGVRLQVLKGHTWVRNVVTATIILFAIRLLFGR